MDVNVGKINTLAPGIQDPTSSAAPLTSKKFGTGGFVGMTVNFDFIKGCLEEAGQSRNERGDVQREIRSSCNRGGSKGLWTKKRVGGRQSMWWFSESSSARTV